MRLRFCFTLLVLLCCLAATGCAGLRGDNPAFPISHAEADRQLRAMRDDPAELRRPVVFVGPFVDLFLAEWLTTGELKKHFSNDEWITGVSFGPWMSFEGCRRKLLERVEDRFPSDDPRWTTEVDVIGYSMGGIVARYSALPFELDPIDDSEPGKRLRVARLFTIASPHRGADMAALGGLNRLAAGMQTDSPLLRLLDGALPTAEYELIPYARLGDAVVGVGNTAPPGRTPYWVSSRPLELAHVQAAYDPRILADIVRRLRGEPPLTGPVPAPLPGETR